MAFITNNLSKTQALLSQYSSCTVEEQTLLRVLAVIYQDVSQSVLNSWLTELVAMKAFAINTIAPALNPKVRAKLKQKGLLNVSHNGVAVNEHIAHPLMLLCAKNDELAKIYRYLHKQLPIFPTSNWSYQTQIQRVRQIRLHFYLKQFDELQMLLEPDKRLPDFDSGDCLIRLCFQPYSRSFFSTLPSFIQYQAFNRLFSQSREQQTSSLDALAMLRVLHAEEQCSDSITLLLAEQELYVGELQPAQQLLATLPVSAQSLALSGWLAFMQGQLAASVTLFEQCIVAKNTIKRRKRQCIAGTPGLFYALALLTLGYQDQPEKWGQLKVELSNILADRTRSKMDKMPFRALEKLLCIFSGQKADIELYQFDYYYYDEDYTFILSVVMDALCLLWQKQTVPQQYLSELTAYFTKAAAMEHSWLAMVCGQILLAGDAADATVNKYVAKHKRKSIDILALIQPKSQWLQALDQLIALDASGLPEASGVDVGEKAMRLVWWITGTHYHRLEAREQKRGKKAWSKGRVVALSKLCNDAEQYDYLSDADRRIISHIEREVEKNYYGYSGREYFTLSGYSALKACIDHPLVYLSDNIAQALEIVEAEPELVITETTAGYKIFMPELPSITEGEADNIYHFSQLTPGRFRLVGYNQKHRQIAQIVSEKGLTIPKNAKDKVMRSLKAIAPLLNIQTDIAGIGEAETGIEQIEPDQRLYINVQPSNGGLQMECHVQPLGEQGPSLLPGNGNSMVVSQIDGKRLSTQRKLKNEQTAFDQLLTACPLFTYMSDHVLQLDDLDEALQCLEQLHLIQDANKDTENKDTENKKTKNLPTIIVQWPKGKAFKLSSPVNNEQMKVSVKQQKDWFALEGELQVNAGEVMALKDLLVLMQGSPSRFIPLGDNKFLALTEQLKQQLMDISGVTNDGAFHSLAAPVVDDAIQGMRLTSNKAWKDQMARLKASFSLEPKIPPTLQADLRDYQKDGYAWASRLAHWGGGACLADDMGLGKTLQALAVILARAAQGPTLVLAPTSVCFNWQDEALRFAPTLSVKLLGAGNKAARGKLLDEAGPFDVIVCSYGLLQTEGKRLTAINWHTVVADEAQAIKNPQAKRSQMAMKLTSDFSMITTGTPIENNLTELWSLFNFINPGLLGNKKSFDERFASVIENADKGDSKAKEASQALRKLISPFILRRLKTDVLTELPSRTEINLHVELSEEEKVFYEALRQTAVEKMLASDDKAGHKRIKVLAEIMKLRRACCHPSLVVEGSPIAGSKLKVFDGLIDELILGGHKALVFSQFVGHLAIMREHLTNKGISFQYLDGSTSAPKRKKAVNAFQAGEGDLFLISLKAGGAGLNLTAADYVIHMDPWWNPAVEDQASDRAHRMGQTRPVTIYRLITQNTIEDKIVALHQQKRDLANSLLEGTDSSGNINYDDMMNLLRT